MSTPVVQDPSRSPPGLDGSVTGTEPRGQASEPSADQPDWLSRAREAYISSTTYTDANYRRQWENSIKAFHSEHPADSKYNNPSYSLRSTIFRPKTRSVIRKNEAVAASAFFSNMDVVDVQGENQDDPAQRISAEVNKALLEYRLNKSIPWFLTVIGALQDAQTQGVVCANVEWRFGRDEEQRIVEDRPFVDLRPIENIRIAPAAHWYDPVNTSPYLIDLIPMYVGDLKDAMVRSNFRGLPCNTYPDSVIRSAMQSTPDTTRMSRNQPAGLDPTTESSPVRDYDVVWVQRHMHRFRGTDWHFYTLGTEALLTEPVPLKQVVFTGVRPYVMGIAILETHRIFPSSVPTLTKGLQDEANEIANQRLDNVKFVLNKRWGVKRGRNVDIQSLLRNVPGSITMADDPETDITEYNWPDVTSSSYQEQDRLNADFDELSGNFSSGSVQTNRKMNETVGGMRMISQSASMLTEYMLRTFTETFVEPVLRMLILLEQNYETDPVILALVADKVKLYQRFGQSQITDAMLSAELTVKVNVGMGATDPTSRLQKFILAVQSFIQTATAGSQLGMNVQEIGKEIFSHAGYQDGRRFFTNNDDPEKASLKAQLQQAQQMLQQMDMALKSKQMDTMAKIQMARESNQVKALQTAAQQKGENLRTGAEIMSNLIIEEMKQAQADTDRTAEAAAGEGTPKPTPKSAPASPGLDRDYEPLLLGSLDQMN